MTWSLDKIEQLKAYVKRGWSASQISRALDTTRNAIIGKLHRLHLHSHGDEKQKGRPRKEPSPKPVAKPTPIFKVKQPLPAIAIEPMKMPEPETSDTPLLLIDLTPTSCRWPINDGNPFLFCGQQRLDHSPYCAAHDRRAHALQQRSPRTLSLPEWRNKNG